MSWSFSVKLLPNETIVEEGQTLSTFSVQAEHTPILTNRRVMFKFNTLSSGLVQSFPYSEIEEARSTSRLMIKYLLLKSGGREHYLKVDDPASWAAKILEYKDKYKDVAETGEGAQAPSNAELVVMLESLHAAGVLTDSELDEKLKILAG